MAVLKEKMPVFWKRSPTQKNVTAQKSLKICFSLYLDGQKEIFIFFEKIFFGTPFEKNFFFHHLWAQSYYYFGLLVYLNPKMTPRGIFYKMSPKRPPPVQTL